MEIEKISKYFGNYIKRDSSLEKIYSVDELKWSGYDPVSWYRVV